MTRNKLPMYRCEDCGTEAGWWSKRGEPMKECSCGSTRVSEITGSVKPEIDPEADTVVLTERNLNALRSDKGGYRERSIETLGVKFTKGWRSSLLGKSVTPETFEAAMELRNKRRRH